MTGGESAAPEQDRPIPRLWSEQASYTLTLGGRFAGVQDWVIRPEGGALAVRVQSDFSGALPAGRQLQESRIDPETGGSLMYAETEGGGRRAQFETVFDPATGLITLRQGRDEASKPLLTDHLDPLALLLWLRDPLRAATPQLRLVGGSVQVQQRPETAMPGEGGGLPDRVYFLRPGGALVTVEREPGVAGVPRRLLSLLQPSDLGPLLATLDRAPAPRAAVTRDAAPAQPGQPGRGQPRRRAR